MIKKVGFELPEELFNELRNIPGLKHKKISEMMRYIVKKHIEQYRESSLKVNKGNALTDKIKSILKENE